MTADPHGLVEAFVTMLNEHDPDLVDRFVAADYINRGTHRRDFIGISGTGRRIEMRSIDIWRVEDGMFAEHWDELNVLQVLAQMGALPNQAGTDMGGAA